MKILIKILNVIFTIALACALIFIILGSIYPDNIIWWRLTWGLIFVENVGLLVCNLIKTVKGKKLKLKQIPKI